MTGFYVTMRRGKKVAWLLGPYDTHGEALADVDRARGEAERVDRWTWFDAFGTAKVTTLGGGSLRPGVLNERVGLHRTSEASP